MATLSLNSGQTFNEKVSSKLNIKSAVYTPYLDKYFTRVQKLGSREVWLNEKYTNDIVQLNGAFTSGGSSMTFDAPTSSKPYQITPNVTHVKTKDGDAIWKITAWNSGTYVATISLAFGTDENVADNTELYLVSYDSYGADFGTDGDEVQFATSDINYPSIIYRRLKSADGNEENRFEDIGINEATIAHQEKKFFVSVKRQLERDLLYNTKTEGTSPATRQSNKISSGLSSLAGGLAQFINAAGGRVEDNSAAAISEDNLISDVEFIREQGGFTDLMNFNRDESNLDIVNLFCTEKRLSDLQKVVKTERKENQLSLSAQVNGRFGAWTHEFIAGGAVVRVYVSSGVLPSDYFMIPEGADIQHKFMYFFDKVEIGKTGHNRKCMYATLFTTCVQNAFTMVRRTNIGDA